MNPTADQLIARSISHNEIAHADYEAGLNNELFAECYDCAETDQTVEFWGDKDGRPWRVHLRNV